MNGAEFWARFALAVLATWRVTHLLANEDGPGDLVLRLRLRLGSALLGRLMDCFYCLSLWVAAPLAWFVASEPAELFVTWLAVSGAACLLERITERPVVMQSSPRTGEGGSDHGLLWRGAVGIPGHAGDDEDGLRTHHSGGADPDPGPDQRTTGPGVDSPVPGGRAG